MKGSIETELKLALPDETAWRWVRDQLGPGALVEQRNHFFDRTDRALREHRIGVRLRSEGPRATLAVKGGGTDRGDTPISRRIELEASVDPDVLEQALAQGLELAPWIERWRRESLEEAADPGEIASFLAQLDALTRGQPLTRYAGFSNRRERLRFTVDDPEGRYEVELELDRTELPGSRVDFEIEVEAGNDRDESLGRTQRALVAWLEREGGIHPTTARSKLARLNAILAATEPDR